MIDETYTSRRLARSAKIPVTQDIIEEHALLVKPDNLRRDDLGNTQRIQIENFTASVGWCVKFVQHHGIRSITLHGQAASATIEEVAEDMTQPRESLREFDADCI